MDQPAAASKAARTPRGGANRSQGSSNGGGSGSGNNTSGGRTRKNGHALKFHNFVANDSWSAATHCLREEHGTKQITVSHWTPSSHEQQQQQQAGSNNKNNLAVLHSETFTFDKQASQSKQQQQKKQSQHPVSQCRPVSVSQQHRSWRRESSKEQQLFSSRNNNASTNLMCSPPAAAATAGQPVCQSSILESLLAKNILAQGHSNCNQPCVRSREAAAPAPCTLDTRGRVQDAPAATHPSHSPCSSSSSPSSLSSSSSSSTSCSPSHRQQEISNTQSNKECTEGKVNRRKAFVVRRVVPTAVLRLGQVEKFKNACQQQQQQQQQQKHKQKQKPGSMCTPADSERTPARDKNNGSSEQPLDLSTKKMSKQFTGQPVIFSKSSQSPRLQSTMCDDRHSVEYLIRSVEQSAAEAASIIARVNGTYTNSSSSSASACSFSSPAPGTSSGYFKSPCAPAASSIPTHNSTVTSIANWVQMNKGKDSDMMMNNSTSSSSSSSSSSCSPFTGPKNTVRQKLEDAFRQNGFLVKTKQVSDGDATFCKFRQLRKYTRYYLKSWHKHLPDEVSQLYKVSYKNFKGFLPPNSDRR